MPLVRSRRSATATVLLFCIACSGDTTTVSENPMATITAASPASAQLGGADMTVTLTGSGFMRQSTVAIGSRMVPAIYVSSTQLQFILPAESMTTHGELQLRVINPEPGGGYSQHLVFPIRAPAPAITSLSVQHVSAGWPGFELRVTGTGFLPSSLIVFNGQPRPTRAAESGVLETTLSEADLRIPGAFPVAVATPGPGGGTSNALALTVTAGTPEITLLPSAGASAGGSDFTLVVHGRGFVQGSVVRWNGSERSTQYISGTRIAATVRASDVAAPGAAQVDVVSPGGAASQQVVFTVRALGSASAMSVQRVPLHAADVVNDRHRGVLYVSVRSTASAHANSVVAIDPFTGAVLRSAFVGSSPGDLAISDDGQRLYVGLNGANAVRAVSLTAFEAGQQWSLAPGEIASDIEVMPGHPGTVAVARYFTAWGAGAGVTIYDNGVARPATVVGVAPNRIAFLDTPDVLYGYNSLDSGFDLVVVGIDAGGARTLSGHQDLIGEFETDITAAAGRIYGSDGNVIDAERQVRVGSFSRAGWAVTAVPDLGRAFILTGSAIETYDLNTFHRLGSTAVGNSAMLDRENPPRLELWGDDGFAFVDSDELVLVRSPIAGR